MTRTLRRLAPDAWLLCASVIAAAAITRLFQGDLGGRATVPLLASAAVGSAVPALLALWRVPLPIRAVAGTVAVILTSLWTAVGDATTSGVPTAHTWHVVQSDLRAARPLLAQFALPLRTAPGLVFLAAMVCGVVGMLSSVLLRASESPDRLYPGFALLGPFALLVCVCSQTTSASMAVLVILFVAAAALTLTTARTQPVRPSGAARPCGWATVATVTACTMAGVAIAAVLVNASAEGAGSSGAGVAPLVPLTAESLTSHLLSVEVHDANIDLFQANSRYRTYWQVAVLNVLRNGVWVPGPVTAGASGQGGPASQAKPATGFLGTEYFKAAVQIDELSSRILPVPPGTVVLSGTAATLTGGGAVSPAPTTSGQQYTATAAAPVTEPEALGGNAPVGSDPPALVAANTALPPLPPSIETLAQLVTSGAQGPLSQAELLENWFRSGLFHYTLTPPASPAGTDPLLSFLIQTRSGSCEQFAGAYVALARSLGLPSRVVVGFTTGRYSGPDEVTVRGADAHVWPQVYLGPRAGWVSFEPTPQQPRGEVAPEGVMGPSGVTNTQTPPPGNTPTTATPPTTPLTVPATVPGANGANGNTGTSTAASRSGVGVLGWSLIAAAVVLAVILVVLLIRRRRRWSPAGRDPDDLALLAQAEVERALRRARVERPLWQPLDLFFEDLSADASDPSDTGSAEPSLVSQTPASWIADGITVARAADAALFDPLPPSEETSRAAYQAALRVRRDLKDVGVRKN